MGKEVYTPTLLWERFKNLVPRFEEGLIEVSGVFEGLTNNKDYRGFYYGKLSDENSRITLKIPAGVVDSFLGNEGKVVTVSGVASWDVKNSWAEVVFTVSNIVTVNKRDEGELGEIMKMKAERKHHDVHSYLLGMLQSKKPRIGIVIGQTAIVDRDVLGALGHYVEAYELNFVRVSLSSREEIGSVLEELVSQGHDLVAIVRGGGSGLEVFNSPELAKKVLSLKKPVVSAIGHAADRSLLDSVVDLSFITPTAFGQFLKTVAEEAERRTRLFELERELGRAKERISSLQRENFWLKAAAVTAIAVALGAIFYVVRFLIR